MAVSCYCSNHLQPGLFAASPAQSLRYGLHTEPCRSASPGFPLLSRSLSAKEILLNIPQTALLFPEFLLLEKNVVSKKVKPVAVKTDQIKKFHGPESPLQRDSGNLIFATLI